MPKNKNEWSEYLTNTITEIKPERHVQFTSSKVAKAFVKDLLQKCTCTISASINLYLYSNYHWETPSKKFVSGGDVYDVRFNYYPSDQANFTKVLEKYKKDIFKGTL